MSLTKAGRNFTVNADDSSSSCCCRCAAAFSLLLLSLALPPLLLGACYSRAVIMALGGHEIEWQIPAAVEAQRRIDAPDIRIDVERGASRSLQPKQPPRPQLLFSHSPKAGGTFIRAVLRKVVPAWAKVAKRYGQSRQLGRRAFSKFVRRNLLAWREVSVRHLSLIRGVVDQWQAKGRSFYELPFRAWFLFMDKRRKEKADNDRLILQHTRLKTRQLLWKIMRTWRHQAVFGRVEGLYSRTELMRSLAEQKTHCKGLEVRQSVKSGSQLGSQLGRQSARQAIS